MLYVTNIFLLINFQYLIVQCLIPNLSVHKLDRKLVQRKRKDTLEMCRMFNAESNRLRKEKSVYDTERKQRTKREITPAKFDDNPALNANDAKRVESIVDKLYDDVEENGQRITYRHKNLQSLTTDKVTKNITISSRKFNFAPAELLGPSGTFKPPKDNNQNDDNANKLKWHKRWKHGIVPYFIDPKTYDSHLGDIIIKAFDYFEKATCIRLQRLREKPIDKESLQNVEWLYITNPTGIKQCVHSNEHKENEGVQMVVFGYDCMSQGEIVHEVMHILGFSHEHTRSDRDQYITILWDNIKPGYKKYFVTRSQDSLNNLEYDYASVLHYPPRAFSRNGRVTVLAKPGIALGQRDGLSEIDLEKVNMVYGTECIERNKQYLLKTCPSVIQTKTETKVNITQKEIEDYFKDRLWPFGIVNYKLRDNSEFSVEERENIKAVIRHIEKETCIEFRDLGEEEKDDDDNSTDAKRTSSEDIDKKNTALNNNDTTYGDRENIPNTIPVESGSDAYSVQNNTETIKSDLTDFKTETNDENLTDDKGIVTDQKGTSDNEITTDNDKNAEAKFTDKENSDTGKVDSAEVKQNSKSFKFRSPMKSKISDEHKRVRRETPTPSRRHANNIYVLTRSSEPGCPCPIPGRSNGDKELKISTDCFNSVNDLLHIFVHVLGLDHQHNMYDRDSYLTILWDNITSEITMELKNTLPPAASVGFPYDYQSVMHYPWLQIKDGVTNIMYPIWNDGWAMGHWQGLSSMDVQKLNLLYFKQCLERGKHAIENKKI